MKRQTQDLTISMAAAATSISILVTAIAMAIYGAGQYYLMPERSIPDLIAHHLWHVVALGMLTYICIHLVLHFQLVKPIRSLSLSFYAISRGNLNVELSESHIKEIQQLSEGLEWLADKLQAQRQGSTPAPQTMANQLRKLAAEEDELPDESKRSLIELADELEFGYCLNKEEV